MSTLSRSSQSRAEQGLGPFGSNRNATVVPPLQPTASCVAVSEQRSGRGPNAPAPGPGTDRSHGPIAPTDRSLPRCTRYGAPPRTSERCCPIVRTGAANAAATGKSRACERRNACIACIGRCGRATSRSCRTTTSARRGSRASGEGPDQHAEDLAVRGIRLLAYSELDEGFALRAHATASA